jgi:dihydroneopterin aldolase
LDRIVLKGMRFHGRHGFMPQERDLGQVFEVDVEMSLDLEPAGKQDDLTLTVNYAEVFGLVEEVVTGRPCRLIESVAEQIAGLLLKGFSSVRLVKVTVKKPLAPVKGVFDYMAVEVTRARGQS